MTNPVLPTTAPDGSPWNLILRRRSLLALGGLFLILIGWVGDEILLAIRTEPGYVRIDGPPPATIVEVRIPR